jgi:proton glutamate symport protein
LTESTRVLVALGAAVAGGIAINASGIVPLIRAADFIAPFGTLWVNAIRMTVIPLVASLLVVAVGSTGDVKSIGRIGGRTLLVFFLLLAGTAMVVMPLAATVSRLLPQHADVHQLPIGAAEAADLILVRSYSPNQSGLIRENISQRARQGE